MILCVGCHRDISFLSSYNDVYNDGQLTVSQMIIILNEKKEHIHTDVVPHEVYEIYNLLQRNSFLFSLHPFTILSFKDCLYDDLFISFDIMESGRFIFDSINILDNMISATAASFARCVSFDSYLKYTYYNSPEYSILPLMYLEFENKSRVGYGYCLLK